MFQAVQAGGLSGFATITQTPLRSLADWRRHGPACTGAAFEPASMPGDRSFPVVCTVVVRGDPPLRPRNSDEGAPNNRGQTARHSRKSAFDRSHMSEDNELSCVVGSIYDAALDPVRWTDALAKIAEFVGGQGGAFGSKDMVSKFVNADFH